MNVKYMLLALKLQSFLIYKFQFFLCIKENRILTYLIASIMFHRAYALYKLWNNISDVVWYLTYTDASLFKYFFVFFVYTYIYYHVVDRTIIEMFEMY